jgi:hypothetical protein
VVLPMREALTSRLDGTYYRAQVDRHLLRRLRSLAARRRAPAPELLSERPDRRPILSESMPADLERPDHQSTWARTPAP